MVLVWVHMKYSVQFWAISLSLETGDHPTTKMIGGLESMTREESLRLMGLFNLAKRKLRGNVTTV